MHKYAYVHGDPVQGMDPLGLARECTTGNSYFCRVGNAVHDLIQQDFEDWGAQNGKTVEAESRNSHFQNAIVPDLINFSDAKIGEIKPLSSGGVTKGYAQIRAAISIANGIETTYGGWSLSDGTPLPILGNNRKWKAESWGPGLKGVKAYYLGAIDPTLFRDIAVTLGNWKGLIVYKRFKVKRGLGTQEALEHATSKAKDLVRSLGTRTQELTFNESVTLDHQWTMSVNVGQIALTDMQLQAITLNLTVGLVAAVAIGTMNTRMGAI